MGNRCDYCVSTVEETSDGCRVSLDGVRPSPIWGRRFSSSPGDQSLNYHTKHEVSRSTLVYLRLEVNFVVHTNHNIGELVCRKWTFMRESCSEKSPTDHLGWICPVNYNYCSTSLLGRLSPKGIHTTSHLRERNVYDSRRLQVYNFGTVDYTTIIPHPRNPLLVPSDSSTLSSQYIPNYRNIFRGVLNQ